MLPASTIAKAAGHKPRWAVGSTNLIEQPAERGIDFQTDAVQAGKPDGDPFDLLCHLAFNAPFLTRRQRAERVRRDQASFFTYYAPEPREILNELLEKCAADGKIQFTLREIVKVPSISGHGSLREIIRVFGGPDELRSAVSQLQGCSMQTETSILNYRPPTGSKLRRDAANPLRSLL